MATEMFSAIGQAPPFGFGIGRAPMRGIYAATGELAFTLAEYEWTRVVLECGPVFGLLVIGVRVALTLWCGAIALRANVANGDAGPLVIFGYVAPLLFYSQISGQNTLLSFCWFSLGLLLALARTFSRRCGARAPHNEPPAGSSHGQAQKLARNSQTQIRFRVRRARADAAVALG